MRRRHTGRIPQRLGFFRVYRRMAGPPIIRCLCRIPAEPNVRTRCDEMRREVEQRGRTLDTLDFLSTTRSKCASSSMRA
jgi:hypothetical protein